jgi:ribose transport system ATP-binding protein
VAESRGMMLFRNEQVYKNVSISILGRIGRMLLNPRREREITRRHIEDLQIRPPRTDIALGNLSGGNQQKVALGRLLHQDADILLLDEPTRGIDVASKVEIYKLIDALVSRQKAVLLVSSYLPELLGVCDRIAVMSRGRLGPARPVEEWTEHSLLMDASGARAAS